MNLNKIIFLTTLGFTVIACATPMSKREIEDTAYHCDNVDRQIASLKNEKENNSRVISSARSIIPIGVLAGIIQLNYFDHLSVAVGRQGKAIDNKVVEMENFESTCS